MSLTLTPAQVDVLVQVAEREHGTPPHPYARAELRAARALAVLGHLKHLDPDGDGREFALTPTGADAYDQLPTDAHTQQPYTTTVAAFRAAQAADAESEILRTAVLNAHAALLDYTEQILAGGDPPEQGDRYRELADEFRLTENAYTMRTGRDPFVGLVVTIGETGDHEWRITDRSRYHGTCELTSTVTGEKHPHWVGVADATAAARAYQRLVPERADRPIPASYVVERDDLGDDVWETVAKGPTGVAVVSPIELGIVAREIEATYREAGCTGVLYRVTVSCGDRDVTAYTPTSSEPCDCNLCKPFRQLLTAVPDLEENTTTTTDSPAAESRISTLSPVHVWEATIGGKDRVYVQLGDDGPMRQTTDEPAGSFEHHAEDLVLRGKSMVGSTPTADHTRVATWQLVDGTKLLVDRGDLNPATARFVDLAPDGIGRDAWSIARDMTDPALRSRLVDDLDDLLNALAVRLDRRGLTIRICETATGGEVFNYTPRSA